MSIRKYFSKSVLIVLLLVLLVVIQLFQNRSVNKHLGFLEERQSSQINEIGQISEAFTLFGQDVNELRVRAMLPKKDYTIFKDPNAEVKNVEEDKNTNSVQLSMFKYVEFLGSQKGTEKAVSEKLTLLEGLSKSETFLKFLSDNSLLESEFSNTDLSAGFGVNTQDGLNIVVFFLDKKEGVLYQKSPLLKEEIAPIDLSSFESKTISYITENKDKIISKNAKIVESKAKLDADLKDEKISASLIKNGLKFGEAYEKDLKYSYPILNKSEEILAELVLDLDKFEISLVDKKDPKNYIIATDLITAVPSFLEKLSPTNFFEKKVKEARDNIETTIKDGGFISTLQRNGLTISDIPREDEDRYYYDILDDNKVLIGSIVVEKSNGVINIVDPNGTNTENLLFFDPEDQKKNELVIPEDLSSFNESSDHEEGTFNILIAGKNGNLVDTMIFAHVNDNNKTVKMISIPRDLFYNGRKINAFAYFYGMPELKKVLSDISGYQLDKYILIDMYAFIDVIDLIGGIDIHLSKPVIDPTYRTVDNGKVGTLHYEPGDYHLGGKESLRLARSRHTSSDFARAERQQLILKALQNKAKNFGFGDADTFYEIVKTVLSKTETDIAFEEAISYYFKYQDYEIMSNDVISSGNILYVPPYTSIEDCQQRIAAAAAAGLAKPGCEADNHAYTLLPRNNNWNVVKWYFKEKFEGDLEVATK